MINRRQGTDRLAEQADPIMELFEDNATLKGPPKATLTKRAKSYSDFYEVAVQHLGDRSKAEKPRDPFDPVLRPGHSSVESKYEDLEEDLLDESHEDYQ